MAASEDSINQDVNDINKAIEKGNETNQSFTKFINKAVRNSLAGKIVAHALSAATYDGGFIAGFEYHTANRLTEMGIDVDGLIKNQALAIHKYTIKQQAHCAAKDSLHTEFHAGDGKGFREQVGYKAEDGVYLPPSPTNIMASHRVGSLFGHSKPEQKSPSEDQKNHFTTG